MGSTNQHTKRELLALALAQVYHNGNGQGAHARRVLKAAQEAGVTNQDLVRAKAELGLPRDVDDSIDSVD